MAKPPTNMAASVRQRLLNLARDEGRVFDVVLVAFGLERLIYRLSVSQYQDQFVLKGGMLVTLWTTDPGRFTRDVDFLGHGKDDEQTLIDAFADILSIDANDGLVFDTAEITASEIREDQVYGGKRLKTTAHLGKTKIPITVDLGFGDALSDPAYEIEYASLLDFEPATIRAYSPATVMAEKFQAVVALGAANSRMKDFYDLWAIPEAADVEIDDLAMAVQRTFERRATRVPERRPDGLSDDFTTSALKMDQWAAYSEATDLEGVTLKDVADDIWLLMEPACEKAQKL
ncbi:MAG: nucleotidyl transferase AbiEii/AbiGii toxin family protein [Pseudomonadota bacterium]